MVDTIVEANPGVKPPTYEISNQYLKLKVEDYQMYIKDMHWLWQDYDCTLMCNRETMNYQYHLVNFMVYYKTGTVFLKFVDTTSNVEIHNIYLA